MAILVKKTAAHKIFKRKDGRYSVTTLKGLAVNGDEKAEILLAEGLIQVNLAAKAPVEEAPAEEAPVEESPAEEAPAEEAPAEEAAEEAPAEEAPAEEAPAEEAPADEEKKDA